MLASLKPWCCCWRGCLLSKASFLNEFEPRTGRTGSGIRREDKEDRERIRKEDIADRERIRKEDKTDRTKLEASVSKVEASVSRLTHWMITTLTTLLLSTLGALVVYALSVLNETS